MVNISLKRQEVDVHLSSSVAKDPEFSFYAYAKDKYLEARGTLSITRSDESVNVTVFVDRRHLDKLIEVLSNMRNKIDEKEAKAAGF
jgi:hypothetical protein